MSIGESTNSERKSYKSGRTKSERSTEQVRSKYRASTEKVWQNSDYYMVTAEYF